MNIDAIAAQLHEVGYIVLDAPLLKRLSSRLLVRCQDDGDNRFQAAQVGRGLGRQEIGSLRGDAISWLDNVNRADCAYLNWMEELRVGLNQALYLGLFDYESHYSIYRSGTGYARHSDVLGGKRNRILSTVFYLNEDWLADDGGELILFAHIGDAAIATINPTFGKMVIFLSESFPHEVLAACNTRRSIAGWFRGR
jgi:SM-20-related protein